MSRVLFFGLVALALVCTRASSATPIPPELRAVDVNEHLGDLVPRRLSFLDHDGARVELGTYFTGRRPVILTLVYFDCPMLCNLVLSGLTRSLRLARLTPGEDADLLTVSIDPEDAPREASVRRRHYLQAIGQANQPGSWPFLTGPDEAIHALADAVGFRYAPVPHARQFAHPAVIMILTPDGAVSRYLYGVDPPVRDLRLAVAEASQGRSGTSFDRFLLQCFHYDPATRRYGVYISTYFRIGGALLLGAMGSLLFALWKREAGVRSST